MQIERRQKYSSNKSNKHVKTDKILDINFDLSSLNLMCSYILSANRNIKRGHLINMRNLFEMLNDSIYEKDAERYKRLIFIRRGTEARLSKNLKNIDLIKKHIDGGFLENSLLDYNQMVELSNDEIEWINGTVSTSLKYAFIEQDVSRMGDLCLKFQSADYITKETIAKEIEEQVAVMSSKFRRAKVEKAQESIFSIRDNMEDTIRDYYEELSNPGNMIITGMQGMNKIIGGGYECGRVYLYLGLQGEGKSWTLLNIAKQIKKYNNRIKPKDPTKRPCVVLLTMENVNRENVARLFSMVSNDEKMTDYTVEEVLEILKNDGEMVLTEDSPVDIIMKFVPTNSVDTSYLYTLTDDLEDDGYEVIAFIQDYVMRIRSTESFHDVRLEYGAIIDEFKVFAAVKDIPVITVSQLNRDAATKIDEGKKTNKVDLVRLLGRSNIAESVTMINNADFVGILAAEYDSDGHRWLGVQVVKTRFKIYLQYCFLPFNGNTMGLLEDYNSDEPVYKDTLRGDGQSNNNSNVKFSVYQPQINSINDIKSEDDISTHNVFEDFNFSGSSISSNNPTTMQSIHIPTQAIKTEKIHLPINQNLPLVSDETGEELKIIYINPIQFVNPVAEI